MQRLMKKHELAKYFGVSCATIYRYTKEGKLPKPILQGNNYALYDRLACEEALGIRSTNS